MNRKPTMNELLTGAREPIATVLANLFGINGNRVEEVMRDKQAELDNQRAGNGDNRPS
jgi:hypothetical protein